MYIDVFIINLYEIGFYYSIWIPLTKNNTFSLNKKSYIILLIQTITYLI
jgi:hypothetical protein